MGRTPRNDDTFARLADPLGYVDKDDIFHLVIDLPYCRGIYFASK